MTNPATVQDLTARSLRPLTDAEKTWGTTRLDDAWDIITSQVPDIESRVSDAKTSRLVVQVECAMVLRVLNNPTGALETSQAIDDYQTTIRLDAAVSSGALYLSDAELALLRSDGTSDTAWTVKPAGSGYGNGYWAAPDLWVPLP